MKQLIYILLIAAFVTITIYHGQAIDSKKNRIEPSIVLEWKNEGIPITIQKAQISNLTKKIKISGKLIGRKIRAKIPSSIKDIISINQDFRLTKNKNFKGQVSYISQEESTLYGMYNVELTLNKLIKNLQNEIVVAELLYKNNDKKILVSNKSIVRDQNRTYVWIEKNNKAYKQTITLGDASEDYTEIKTGLNENDKVIVEGKEFLEETVKVKVVKEL